MKRLITYLALCVGAFALGVTVERYFWDAGSDQDGSSTGIGDWQMNKAPSMEDGSRSSESAGGSPESALDLAGLQKVIARSGGDDSEAARRMLHRATPEQIEKLAAGLDSLDSNDPNQRALKVAIFRRWADVDPKGALGALLAESDFRVKSEVIHHLFRQLSRQDLPGAKLAATEIENRALRNEAIRAIGHGVGSEDPVAFAQFLESLEDAREFGDFFDRWARKDPAEASRYVESVQDDWKRREWTRGIARGWARSGDPSDTSAALAWAKSLKSGRERAEAVHSIAQTMSDSDPASAALLLNELPADHTQRNFVEHLARTWAEQDLNGAISWAESLGVSLRSQAIEALLPQWVRTDAVSAAAYVEGLPTSESQLNSLRRVAETWSRIDKDSALAWAGSQENPAAKGRALGAIAREWARDDPQAASEMVALLGQSEERLQVLDEVARSWSGENLDLALGWIEDLPSLEQNRAYRGLLDNVTEFDPAQAAAIYGKLASSEGGSDSGESGGYAGMAGHIAERWSEYDPATAADWALNLPEGDTQRHAVERVADRWMRADPLEASQWIGELERGSVRDVATERLVDQIAESDPDSALQWALSAQDHGHQTNMIRHVYERWNRTDPAAAQRSFNSVPVSTEQRAELQGVFK